MCYVQLIPRCVVFVFLFFRIKSWPETIDGAKIDLSVLKSICVGYVGVVMADRKYDVGSHSAGVYNVQIFITIFGFSMNNAFRWEQISLPVKK